MAEIKKISTELQLLDKFLDTSGDAGTSGQILSSTATGINWINGSAIPGVPGGSGTLRTIPMWTPDGDTLGNSVLKQDVANQNIGLGITPETGMVTYVSQLRIGEQSAIQGHTDGVGADSFTVVTTNWKFSTSGSQFINGTTSAPGYANMYQQQVGEHTFSCSTASGVAGGAITSRIQMVIKQTGNVGIGTTSPGTLHSASYGFTRLHIDGGTDRGQMIIEGDSFAGIVLSDNGATANQRVFVTSVDETKYTIKPLNDNGTSTAGGVAFTVLHGGNVGIGTTSPTGYRLVVENTSEDLLKLHNSTDGLDALISFTNPGGTLGRIQGIANGGLGFDVGNNAGGINTNAMFISNLGKVGIGTTSLAADSILTIATTASTGLTLLSVSNAGESFLNFADTADVNAGRIYYGHGDNAMRFRTNDGLRMIIDSSGNVGIGTTSPNTYSNQTTLTINGSTYGRIDLESGGTLRSSLFSQAANTSLTVDTGFFSLDTGGSERMRITSTGNVGIGTTSPNGKLTISDANATGLEINPLDSQNRVNIIAYDRVDSAYRELNFDGSNYNFEISNSTKMVIDTSGNVGIGTTLPNVSGVGSESVVLSVIETSGNRRGILELGDNQNADTGGIGSINFVGHYQNAGHKIMAEIRASGSGATSGQRGSFIGMFTKENGAAAIAERMRISSTGSVKFNAYNGTNNTGSPTHILGTDANGLIVKSTAGSSIGPWLPLAAGSGDPLTGDLYINKSAPALRLNDSGDNVPYELRVDGTTFSIKEVTNSRTLMSMTAGAVITLDSLGSNTVINTTGAMVVPNGKVGIGTTGPGKKLDVVSTSGTSIVQSLRNPSTSWNQYALTRYGTEGADFRYMDFGYFRGNNNEATRGLVVKSQANATLVTFLDAGNVGIGITNPSSYDSNADNLVIGSIGANDKNGITIVGGDTDGRGAIYFADTTQNSAGYITYKHTDNSMLFGTSDTTAMEIDSSQNVRTYAKLGIRVDGDAIPWRGTAQIPAVIDLAGNGAVFTRPDNTFLSQNFYYNANDSGAVIDAGQASMIQLTPGEIIFAGSTTGASSNATISVLERMRVASNGGVGINTTNPTEKLEVNGNVKVQGDIIVNSDIVANGDIELGPSSRIQLDDTPTASTASGSGTIVNWSVSESTTAGTLYTVKSNGGWTTTDADAEGKSIGMLAIALGSNATAGMLLQGFFYKASHGFTIGLPLYISNTAGAFSTTRPTGTNDYVRIIGYATSANYIYFDPDKTWVKVA